MLGRPRGGIGLVVLVAAVSWAVERGVHAMVASDPPHVSGLYLDHVSIAVRDLDAATNWWRERLGFSIKPGRFHENTLDNSHMKFPDGTEIELITAAEPAATRSSSPVESVRTTSYWTEAISISSGTSIPPAPIGP